MKLLITSYYDLKESLLCASNALTQLGFVVTNYPLFRYYMDNNDKLDNYVDHFIDYIKQVNPDIILWWYIGIPSLDMDKIVNNSSMCKHIFFNWDEPQNWSLCDIKNKAKYFDSVFVCCEEKLNDYINLGTKHSYLLYPGFDKQIHHPLIEDLDDIDKYSCDISFICTNLYTNYDEFPNQFIPRKQLVDDIYLNQKKYGYVFHLYGPQQFGELYPDSYKGFINYEDTNKVFNYSKINLCTHVNYNQYKYLNERTFMILGSGGLLYVDPVYGIHDVVKQNECVIIDKDYINQIVNILDNYDDYYIIRHNGYKRAIKEHTWLDWAAFIKNKIE